MRRKWSLDSLQCTGVYYAAASDIYETCGDVHVWQVTYVRFRITSWRWQLLPGRSWPRSRNCTKRGLFFKHLGVAGAASSLHLCSTSGSWIVRKGFKVFRLSKCWAYHHICTICWVCGRPLGIWFFQGAHCSQYLVGSLSWAQILPSRRSYLFHDLGHPHGVKDAQSGRLGLGFQEPWYFPESKRVSCIVLQKYVI